MLTHTDTGIHIHSCRTSMRTNSQGARAILTLCKEMLPYASPRARFFCNKRIRGRYCSLLANQLLTIDPGLMESDGHMADDFLQSSRECCQLHFSHRSRSSHAAAGEDVVTSLLLPPGVGDRIVSSASDLFDLLLGSAVLFSSSWISTRLRGKSPSAVIYNGP